MFPSPGALLPNSAGRTGLSPSSSLSGGTASWPNGGAGVIDISLLFGGCCGTNPWALLTKGCGTYPPLVSGPCPCEVWRRRRSCLLLSISTTAKTSDASSAVPSTPPTIAAVVLELPLEPEPEPEAAGQSVVPVVEAAPVAEAERSSRTTLPMPLVGSVMVSLQHSVLLPMNFRSSQSPLQHHVVLEQARRA